jgi:hypothetical protein
VNPEQIRAGSASCSSSAPPTSRPSPPPAPSCAARGADRAPRRDAGDRLRAARAAIVGIDADLDQQQAALREALDEQTRDANAAALRAELGDAATGGRAAPTSAARSAPTPRSGTAAARRRSSSTRSGRR